MIIDDLPDDTQLWDVCLVGAGLVGIALALECENLGLSVLLLEAGGREPNWSVRLSKPKYPIRLTTRRSIWRRQARLAAHRGCGGADGFHSTSLIFARSLIFRNRAGR